jgi:hypothetical protein
VPVSVSVYVSFELLSSFMDFKENLYVVYSFGDHNNFIFQFLHSIITSRMR